MAVLQQTAPTRARFHDGFFIVDPEATLLVNLTHRLRLTSGMGYRLISGFSNGMLSNAGGCGRACRNA